MNRTKRHLIPALFSLALLSFAMSWITKHNRLFINLCDLIFSTQVIHFKLGDSFFKNNFRPISVLAISKFFERLMSKQVCPFGYRLLSNLLCVFRNGHSAEHALFRLTDMCRKALADRKVVGMVLYLTTFWWLNLQLMDSANIAYY